MKKFANIPSLENYLKKYILYATDYNKASMEKTK